MEAEIPRHGDFKSTFVGDTPVVVTRTEDNRLAVWVNRCAHRGALVCRSARGNTKSHICAYHQWSYDSSGNLRGVPFRNGIKGAAGCRPTSTPSSTASSNYAPKIMGAWSLPPSVTKCRRFMIILAQLCGPGSTASSKSLSNISVVFGSTRDLTGSFTTKMSGILITRRCYMVFQHFQYFARRNTNRDCRE